VGTENALETVVSLPAPSFAWVMLFRFAHDGTPIPRDRGKNLITRSFSDKGAPLRTRGIGRRGELSELLWG
jgi:hypothetical protein